MKLSKFVKRAKSESYCMVIHADDSGIWLGTRLALYNATELPEMEGKEQVGAVLDIDSKAWEKMFFDEKYAETAGAAFGVNLTDADPLEQEARRVPLEMFYKGMGLVGLMYGNAGELIFYDSALIAPIADVVKNSDYIQTVVRKTAGGAPYVVIKDGFEVLAGFVPLKIITKQFLEDLSEFESACVSQYMREANGFVQQYHRHHKQVAGHKFSIGVAQDGKLVGVAICGRPVSRRLDNGTTLEVNRLCTDGTRNACSILYAAAARAARDMGYKKIITYILASEPGVSLRAAGFTCEGKAGGLEWNGRSKPKTEDQYPHEMKTRWGKKL